MTTVRETLPDVFLNIVFLNGGPSDHTLPLLTQLIQLMFELLRVIQVSFLYHPLTVVDDREQDLLTVEDIRFK